MLFRSTYRRMMTLAKRKYAMDDSILMQIMVEAYPVVVFTKQLEDRSRKIMEIIEGEDYLDGKLVYRSLYKYHVEDNVTDSDGNAQVLGHHQKAGAISAALQKRLLDNGIPHKELEEFLPAEPSGQKAATKTAPAKKAAARKPKSTAAEAGSYSIASAGTGLEPARENDGKVNPAKGKTASGKQPAGITATPETAMPEPPETEQTI